MSVVWYPQFGDPTSETSTTYALWLDGLSSRGGLIPGIWVDIEDGVVVRISEQWVP